jgi:hypothetical protein
MSRCILLPCSLLIVLIQLVCQSMMGTVCIRWSKLIVVLNCEQNSWSAMVVYQSVVISLGIKRVNMLYFLVTTENPNLTFIDIVLL